MGIRQRRRSNSLGMLILNIVLICAIIVNGTYAWIHIGQSVNGALLYINDEYEVELQKFERLANGEYTEVPMEGVGFALFTSSDEQIGDVRYTNDEGKIYATVPVGEFYFKEIYYPKGWGPDTDEDGEYILEYPFTILGEQDTDEELEVSSVSSTETVEETQTDEDFDADEDSDADAQTDEDSDADVELIVEEELDETEEPNEIKYITVYNQPLNTYLEIEKTVKNLDGSALSDEQLDKLFEFTIEFGDDNEYNYYILNADGTQAVKSDTPVAVVELEETEEETEEVDNILADEYIEEVEPGVYSTDVSNILTYYTEESQDIDYLGTITSGDKVYLKHGQSVIIDECIIGLYYSVVETEASNYAIESYNASGNLDFGANDVQFINTYNTVVGGLTVTKEVQGDGFEADKLFEFTITLDGEETKFYLKDGETHNFGELPVGTNYKVEEKDYKDEKYYASVLSYEGTLQDTVDVDLLFINVYDPENTPGDLVIYKEVIGDTKADDLVGESEEEQLFTFQVVLDNPSDPENPEVHEFELADGEFYVVEDIDMGTKYTVQEIDSNGYLPDYEEVTGYIVGKKYDELLELEEQDIQIVTFYNRVPEYKMLAVNKMVTGDIPELHKGMEFEFTLRVNGNDEVFTLTDKETKTFQVPLYSTYTVTEKDYSLEGYNQDITAGTGTIINELTEVLVVNDYQQEMIDIQGEKTWDTNPLIQELIPNKIEVELWCRSTDANGVTVEGRVETKEVYSEGGVWNYTFQAAKDNSYGIPFEYYIQEVDITNFVPEYDGYNIYNQYVEETVVELPTVEKQLEGINSSNEKFTFVLKAIDDAPMPTGVATGETVQVIYGAGSAIFGNIKYTSDGVYKYTITEVNDGLDDWIYDATVYNYEVEVKLEDGILKAYPNLSDSRDVANKIIFTNEYVGEDSSDSDSDTEEDDSLVATHQYIEGRKTWSHGLNSTEHQPNKLVVYILGDGEVYQAIETYESKNWSYKFLVPILDENGKEITYTIGEEPVDGYNGVAIGYDLYNTFDLASLVEPDSPQTSDYSQIWIWVWGLVASTITFVYVNRRKRVLRHGRRW